MAKCRVGILFGGKSVEHEVSLQSARNVYEAIDKSKFDVVLIGVDKSGRWQLRDTRLLQAATSPKAQIPDNTPGASLDIAPGKAEALGLDVVFPLIHGTHGEDGTVQGLLELANLPFVGAGVLGSAVGMDKDVTKRLLRDAGIPIARFVTLTCRTAPAAAFDTLAAKLGTPFFVKPANSGSSVGTSKVRTAAEWEAARAEALRYDRKILVEEFIHGQEVEVAVLGNDEPQASIPGEIVPTHEFYSYAAKYLDDHGADLRIPAAISPEAASRVREIAIQAFLALECSGMARVDFFVATDGRTLVNEINTIPGFTKISMYPKLWEATGLSYSALIERLIHLALERHATKQRMETSLRPRLKD